MIKKKTHTKDAIVQSVAITGVINVCMTPDAADALANRVREDANMR